MSPKLVPEIEEMLQAVTYAPCISIIMPFEPKMLQKSELERKLKIAYGKAESEVMENYSHDQARLVLEKLKAAIKNLDYSTYKKSIAIFISSLKEKVFYLDIPVEEKVIVDKSFEIRDLVYSKKEMQKYLVLVLSAKKSRIYLGSNAGFVRIVSNIPDYIAAYQNDIPERVGNFSDPSDRKEIMLDKFLRHTDGGLSIILKAYHLPLFVMGAERVIGHFNSITKNKEKILGYVHGNYEDASEEELHIALEPQVSDWKKVRQKDILYQMTEAAGNKKLVAGMEKVWKEASGKKGRLLIVEKSFSYPARLRENKSIIYYGENKAEEESYIKDAVDDVIEKVFEYGGDVEFVDNGVLKDFGRIALVLYY